MNQRLSVITLAAEDLPAMRNFYIEKFNWQPVAENKDIVFFKLNGLLLGLYGRKNMAAFNNTSPQGSGFRPFNLAYMVNSEQEVEELYIFMKNNGVKIVQAPAVPDIGGRYFLMADVEGNVWEVAYNLFIPIDKNGNVITHQPIDHL